MIAFLLLVACSARPDDEAPTGYDGDADGFSRTEDCDDGDAGVHPDAVEVCDGVDQDCDGAIDEDAADLTTWYADADGDGEGDAAATRATCSVPQGYVAVAGDCNDHDGAVNRGAVEVCNGYDDDCDGLVDDADAGVSGDHEVWPDADGDHYGADGASALRCARAGDGESSRGGDCDDGDPGRYPGAPEACDGVDADCAGDLDLQLVTNAAGETWTSVKGALQNATDGDTIRVCPGTYSGALVVTRDVTVEGYGGAPEIVLSGGGAAPTVTVQAGASLTLRHVTVTEGSGVNGGGIAADSAQALTLDDCVVTGNDAEIGGGLYGPENGALTITDSTIASNSAAQVAGGLVAFGGSILASEIATNSSPVGGGAVFISTGATIVVDLTDTVIVGNLGEGAGGGVAATGVVEVSGGEIDANASPLGGGVYGEEVLLTMTGTWVHRNAGGGGGYGGGGFFVDETTLELAGCTVEENTSSEHGAGVYARRSLVQLDGGAVTVNQAADEGGGVALHDGAWLDALGTDFGTGETDNAPDDVWLASVGESWSAYGAAADVYCDEAAGTCTP